MLLSEEINLRAEDVPTIRSNCKLATNQFTPRITTMLVELLRMNFQNVKLKKLDIYKSYQSIMRELHAEQVERRWVLTKIR